MNHTEASERVKAWAMVYLEDRIKEPERFRVDPVETTAWIELAALVQHSHKLMNACRMVASDMKLTGNVSRHSLDLCERAFLDFVETYEAKKNH